MYIRTTNEIILNFHNHLLIHLLFFLWRKVSNIEFGIFTNFIAFGYASLWNLMLYQHSSYTCLMSTIISCSLLSCSLGTHMSYSNEINWPSLLLSLIRGNETFMDVVQIIICLVSLPISTLEPKLILLIILFALSFPSVHCMTH